MTFLVLPLPHGGNRFGIEEAAQNMKILTVNPNYKNFLFLSPE